MEGQENSPAYTEEEMIMEAWYNLLKSEEENGLLPSPLFLWL